MQHHDNVGAFVLAGGASQRMGRDKALLELNGLPMLMRTMRLLDPLVSATAVVAPAKRYASLGFRVVEDGWPGAGPLGAIITALRASSLDWNLILACDLPFLTAEWIEWLIARGLSSTSQAVVPESSRGLEPLAAIYHRDCEPVFSTAFDRGTRSVREALRGIAVERVTKAQWAALKYSDLVLENINTSADFAAAARRMA